MTDERREETPARMDKHFAAATSTPNDEDDDEEVAEENGWES